MAEKENTDLSVEKKSQVEMINQEINRELSNENVGKALLATTFKGLNAVSMKQAIMEGMIRGFKFRDFLDGNVYAISFGQGYSLINSIGYNRKIGIRSGIVGENDPVYKDKGKQIYTCTVTVKRKFADGYIGDFTATVYFDEYNTKKNQWASKPRTMIAKVAEMHALRKACPEELAQSYIEEEMELEAEKRTSRTSGIKNLVEDSKLKMKDLQKNEESNKNQEDTDKFDAAESAALDQEHANGQ